MLPWHTMYNIATSLSSHKNNAGRNQVISGAFQTSLRQTSVDASLSQQLCSLRVYVRTMRAVMIND